MAYRKPTAQTRHWGGLTSEKAVDGNADTHQPSGSCAHPDDGSIRQAWWRVDLRSLHRIHSVTVYNTNDGVGEQCIIHIE